MRNSHNQPEQHPTHTNKHEKPVMCSVACCWNGSYIYLNRKECSNVKKRMRSIGPFEWIPFAHRLF